MMVLSVLARLQAFVDGAGRMADFLAGIPQG